MEDTARVEELQDQAPADLQVPGSMKSLIETLIFAARDPLSIRQLKAIYEWSSKTEDRTLEAETIRGIIKELNEGYARDGRGYRIVAVAGGYQFATLSPYADWVGKLYKEQGRRRLSQSGMETLAIIAYKQPITKGEIESIRGVNCDYVLKSLLEKELITVTGRAETVGRPLLYGTTRDFLKHFGLNEITDLPRPREIEEILGESEFETDRRMLEAQAGADATRREQEDFKSRLPHIPKKKPGLDRQVEIVPRRRTREIKTVAHESQQSLEQAGQEAIHFAPDVVQDQATKASASEVSIIPPDPESPKGSDRADSEPAIEIARMTGNPESPPEQSAEDTVEPVVEEHRVLELADHPTANASSIEPEATGRPFITSHARPVVADPPPVERTEQSRPNSPWRTWKEKIQGFIRKLFA